MSATAALEASGKRALVSRRITFILFGIASLLTVGDGSLTGSSASPSALPADASPDWWSRAQQQIADSEYEVTWQDHPRVKGIPSSWHAPNRAQGIRTFFTAEGLRVIPRVEETPSWQWSLRLAGLGRGGTLLAAEPPVLTPRGSRITYDRGSVVEWYVNDRRGLEQGFTLSAPPEEQPGWPAADEAAGAILPAETPLAVTFTLDGDLSPIVSSDGQAIDFVTPSGARVLRYAELRVADATGRSLTARMEGWSVAGARGIRLVVDDHDAIWPLTIDPLLTSPAWTAEGDQDGARFGISVGTAGDVNNDGYSDVIVGADVFDDGDEDEGAAFVYHGSPSGLSLNPNWSAQGDLVNAFFGRSVGTAGDVNGDGYSDVIVGAPLYSNGQPSEGRAFVYHGSASGLSLTPNWSAESDQGNAGFGFAVGTAGDVNGDGYSDVIVGALYFTNGEAQEGRAFVYHGSASGLSLTSSWTAESDQASASLGYSVGTAGDVNGDGYADVIVGTPFYDNLSQVNVGRAHVYHGSATGLSLSAAWTFLGDQPGAFVGSAVGTAGDLNGDGYADVIVGAYGFDNGQTDEGRAFAHLGSPSGLSLTPNWSAESDQGDAVFGYSVGTAGDLNGDGYADVIVGAYGFDNGQTDEGRAFAYLGSPSGLSLTSTWTAESNQASAIFGAAVGTAGDVNGDGYADVIVGAELFDNGQTDEGRAFVYHGSASALSLTPGWTTESDQTNAHFGRSVGTAGDVNGDGYADVIVGAFFFDNGETDEGRAFVYLGSPSGLSSTPSWNVESNQAFALFGMSVGTAGDVNGDGYADVIVGAPGFTNGEVEEGRAFVYLGSPTGLSLTPSWNAESNQEGASFGSSVGTAGDVNDDGFADVIVAADLFDNPELDEGRVFVYHGSASGLSITSNWMTEGDQEFARFGISVGTAGDVNRDGHSDVIVGAYTYSNGQPNEGRAFVYHGSASGLSLTSSWTAESDQVDAHFGLSAGTAGDVNGDGYSDVIVGAGDFDNGQTNEGRAYVYHGSASGLSLAPSWTVESDLASARFGLDVGTAGDVNGDGYADVIVGAANFSNPLAGEGGAFVYHGSASGLSSTSSWSAEGNQSAAVFGTSVGTAGDVNGDGYADVIVGADMFDNGQTNEGRAFLYYGNGGPTLSLRPQQRRSDDSAPIAPLGASDSQGGFRLAALGRSPFGRGLVKLEWEVDPLGTPLDGSGTQSGAGWLDTGTTGVSLNEMVAGLPAGTVHHWRLRLRYHPATIPFQSRGRWFTVPRNGWQEGDLRTAPAMTDLRVTQTDGADPIFLGTGNLTYTVIVTNLGPEDVPVTLTDTLPGGSVFVGAAPSQGTCAAPAGGVLTCALGPVASGGGASVAVTVTPQAAGAHTNVAAVSISVTGTDPDTSDNVSSETTTVLPVAIGDRVWADSNGDGVQDPGEPGVGNVLVALYDGAGGLLGASLTDASGAYAFPGLTLGAMYRLRFVPPTGSVLSPQDQGADDLLDSDADPITQLTPTFALGSFEDPFRWDAGLTPSCLPPDEPIFISMVTQSTDGNHYPILHYQDGNQPGQVTGYNVYRSSNASLPPASWPRVASDVIDMDEATPNKQWVDSSGDVPPGGIWYYQVTAFNARCPAEGPF